ncbi:DNA-binding transcriptional regulator GbsR (MarR family) [Metabacillus crassostreae]|uniref:GbsR/MarR family transcriptional regulator n=1 Tax=Metabacillus crassostreae TaxID=929098 RepID=UPI001EF8914E|nr:GbsR/MarR family transcriptional regulator [Metabacillus crassostreae]MBM7603916.1 DNA-binding transcriptional regulator GbsR (MarR family) [Metabacillus crassostreae]
MKNNEILDRTRTMVIDSIAQNMNLYGIAPSAGRLYGLLFYSDKPLTLDEMKEELGMSKTSMSNSVRSLLDLNMVEKVWVKGERKDLYTIKEDWYQCFFDFFTIKWRSAITTNSSTMEKSIAQLKELIADPMTPEETRESALQDIQKLEDRIDYYDWQNRLIDSFETKDILNFIPIEKKEE